MKNTLTIASLALIILFLITAGSILLYSNQKSSHDDAARRGCIISANADTIRQYNDWASKSGQGQVSSIEGIPTLWWVYKGNSQPSYQDIFQTSLDRCLVMRDLK